MIARRTLSLGAITLVGIALGALGYRWIASPSWQDAAREHERALSGESDLAIADKIVEEELAALGMDQLRAEEAVKYAASIMVGCEVRAAGTPLKYGTKTVVPFDILTPQGAMAGGVEVFETPNGPRLSLGLLALQSLRRIQFSGERSGDPAWRHKFNEAADTFRSLGLIGYWDIGTGRIQEWPHLAIAEISG